MKTRVKRMTHAERIALIRARVEKATKGPWFVDKNGRLGNQFIKGSNFISLCGDLAIDDVYGYDADFIAHSREDVPFLLAELDRKDAALVKAKKGLMALGACTCPDCETGPGDAALAAVLAALEDKGET